MLVICAGTGSHISLAKSTKTVAKLELLFWVKYAPDRLLAGVLPQSDPNVGGYSAPQTP